MTHDDDSDELMTSPPWTPVVTRTLTHAAGGHPEMKVFFHETTTAPDFTFSLLVTWSGFRPAATSFPVKQIIFD